MARRAQQNLNRKEGMSGSTSGSSAAAAVPSSTVASDPMLDVLRAITSSKGGGSFGIGLSRVPPTSSKLVEGESVALAAQLRRVPLAVLRKLKGFKLLDADEVSVGNAITTMERAPAAPPAPPAPPALQEDKVFHASIACGEVVETLQALETAMALQSPSTRLASFQVMHRLPAVVRELLLADDEVRVPEGRAVVLVVADCAKLQSTFASNFDWFLPVVAGGGEALVHVLDWSPFCRLRALTTTPQQVLALDALLRVRVRRAAARYGAAHITVVSAQAATALGIQSGNSLARSPTSSWLGSVCASVVPHPSIAAALLPRRGRGATNVTHALVLSATASAACRCGRAAAAAFASAQGTQPAAVVADKHDFAAAARWVTTRLVLRGGVSVARARAMVEESHAKIEENPETYTFKAAAFLASTAIKSQRPPTASPTFDLDTTKLMYASWKHGEDVNAARIEAHWQSRRTGNHMIDDINAIFP